MFDKTFTFSSSDGTVSMAITAGTEGVKSIILNCPPAAPREASSQQLIDLATPGIREWFSKDQTQ